MAHKKKMYNNMKSMFLFDTFDGDMRCLSFLKPSPEGLSKAFDGSLGFCGSYP